MGEKRQVADNPLSKNIAKLVGFYDYGSIRARRIIEKITAQTGIKENTIYSWIKTDPSKNDPRQSRSVPSIDNLNDLAKFFGIDDPWDLYNKNLVVIHKQNTIDLDYIEPEKIELIEFITEFNKKQTKAVENFLYAYFQEKENHGKIKRLKIEKWSNLILDRQEP